jgi:hypothetical protein
MIAPGCARADFDHLHNLKKSMHVESYSRRIQILYLFYDHCQISVFSVFIFTQDSVNLYIGPAVLHSNSVLDLSA